MIELVAVISALTALGAVLLGPLVATWIAKKQIQVSVLSNNRQAWINGLRDLIAEYFSITSFVHVADWERKSGEIHDQKMERLMLINSKIRLMLNPTEADHIRLVELLGNLAEGSANARKSVDMENMREYHDAAVILAQSVLKREWERVKNVR